MNLNELANEIHTQNVEVGWWDSWPVKAERYETAMMLVVSELAEAMEGDRKNLMDEHLPTRKMFDVELADAAIRLFDLAGALKVDLSGIERTKKLMVPLLKELSVPEMLFKAVGQTSLYRDHATCIMYTFAAIWVIAELKNVDLFDNVAVKRKYNQDRLDHKRSERAKSNGKKY